MVAFIEVEVIVIGGVRYEDVTSLGEATWEEMLALKVWGLF